MYSRFIFLSTNSEVSVLFRYVPSECSVVIALLAIGINLTVDSQTNFENVFSAVCFVQRNPVDNNFSFEPLSMLLRLKRATVLQ